MSFIAELHYGLSISNSKEIEDFPGCEYITSGNCYNNGLFLSIKDSIIKIYDDDRSEIIDPNRLHIKGQWNDVLNVAAENLELKNRRLAGV